PTRGGGVEHPAIVLPRGNAVLLPLPCAQRGRADNVPVALPGFGGRLGTVAVDDAELHDRVQRPDSLIMRDMLLRLAGHDVGQVEIGSTFHAASSCSTLSPENSRT